jgi:hypothetical protein
MRVSLLEFASFLENDSGFAVESRFYPLARKGLKHEGPGTMNPNLTFILNVYCLFKEEKAQIIIPHWGH